jgi:putative transposase
MPRKARIDAPGALHHVIVRGINRRKIFFDDSDRDDFLDRLGGILSDSKTPCFAWGMKAPLSSVVNSSATLGKALQT